MKIYREIGLLAIIMCLLIGCGTLSNGDVGQNTGNQNDVHENVVTDTAMDNEVTNAKNNSQDIVDEVAENVSDIVDDAEESVSDIVDNVEESVPDIVNDVKDSLINYNAGYIYSSSGKYYYTKDDINEKRQEIIDLYSADGGKNGPFFFSKEGNTIYFFTPTDNGCKQLNRVRINQLTGKLDNKVEKIADEANTYNTVYLDDAVFFTDSKEQLHYSNGNDDHIIASDVSFMYIEKNGYFFFVTGEEFHPDGCYLCKIDDPLNPILLITNVESYHLSYIHDYEPIYDAIYFEKKDKSIYASYDYQEAVEIVDGNDYVAASCMREKAYILKKKPKPLDLRDYLSEDSRFLSNVVDEGWEYDLYAFYECSKGKLKLLYDDVLSPDDVYGLCTCNSNTIRFIQAKEYTENGINLEDTKKFKKSKENTYWNYNTDREWEHLR